MFAPASGALACRQCRATAPLELDPSAEPVLPRALADVVQSHEERLASAVATAHDECPACGAPVEAEHRTLATACRFCREPLVLPSRPDQGLAPQGILPLAVDQPAATAAIRQWLGRGWFRPRALRSAALDDAVAPSYHPCWIVDLATDATYEGRRGDNYTVSHTQRNSDGSMSTVTETRIRWHHAEGTVSLRFHDLVVPSGGADDPVVVHGGELGPWGVADAVPLSPDHLRGTTATSYLDGPAEGYERAERSTDPDVEAAVRDDIGGDHQDIRELRRRDHHQTLRYLLLPVWIVTYTFGARQFTALVNGRSGEVAGTRPLSRAKIAITVAVVAVLVAALVFWLTRRSGSA